MEMVYAIISVAIMVLTVRAVWEMQYEEDVEDAE